MVGDSGRVELDEVDRRILRELQVDGRLSMRVLADRVHISRAHAYNRVERLKNAGTIERFTVRINHTASGLDTSAFIALSIRQDSWRTVSEELRTMQFVDHFSLLGGDFDVLVLVRTPDNEVLRRVVLEGLQGMDGVRSTRTWLIFDEDRGADGENPAGM
ncbi:Lrp/AsnC family transcriptional regulator [Rhodococcus sp. 06-156-3C]|uniref:Lrp/AsnC family transcriptional regulator n=1 Tax=Nocardiaceae TaxID=85025 RepID=UPI000522E9ED|nr:MULTISPECIES: Lrp/AsnC family transcriptional regulator [Rhodococcus]OZD19315.1 Lrp/AsnC family transcriptional regulator [Rhodococcus sp. 06-156-3C]OZD21650.1 Lrp/AsnC family transcriptional regulator [Rhodococcus sp. 06-156-4C]OZD25335.1 Lrp/AsnC family transcriptional regulator [Rhodococcus sp. 06-156-4a]OZD33050.1 Lrp/AsnC family transcriptional regulator [Rhodococcus sp. 06-156-3b]OZD41874.1 Lrp/AsnC family transcriptional regulator [Rhodococcus sp. 06-156-3]